MARNRDELRPISIKRRFTKAAPGSVWWQAGDTIVLCTASVDQNIPPWMQQLEKGWVTAEYNMLPGSTNPRKPRERSKIDGRTTEIQRLIGRSLRAIVDLNALGPRQITIDCEVLQADGGTRTACINAAFIALVDAVNSIRAELPSGHNFPIRNSLASVSVGIVDGKPILDLDYHLDSAASVDMNIVMTGSGEFVEIQGTGEEATFSEKQLNELLKLAKAGIKKITGLQQKSLGRNWPNFAHKS
ncbi:MAG TPA: ribonuclease PH [Pirellulaceae bacterium]|nr:ribonuclease PH [Pirellulaceae bacterium]HMO92710.1 ribonuclease PH [Pirellulaceae bacterium]HMP70370.1 ribonuclease PH [Pirellulaceae bacterium]